MLKIFTRRPFTEKVCTLWFRWTKIDMGQKGPSVSVSAHPVREGLERRRDDLGRNPVASGSNPALAQTSHMSFGSPSL